MPKRLTANCINNLETMHISDDVKNAHRSMTSMESRQVFRSNQPLQNPHGRQTNGKSEGLQKFEIKISTGRNAIT